MSDDNKNIIVEQTENDDEMYRIVEDEVKKLNFVERITALFSSPVKLMLSIKQKPVYGVPLIILMIFCLVSAYLSPKFSAVTMQEQGMISLERYGVDYFNNPAVAQALESFSLITSITTFLGAVIGVIIAAAISALLMLILTKISRGKAKFSQYFSMYLHTAIISTIGGIVLYITTLAFGTTLNMTSLAALFMPGGDFTQPVYNLLSSIGLFTVWEAFLVYIGIKVINEYTPGKALCLTLIMFIGGCVLAMLMSYGMLFYYDFINNTMSGIAH